MVGRASGSRRDDEVSQFLDGITEWQILERVLPLFAMDLHGVWTLTSNDESDDEDEDDEVDDDGSQDEDTTPDCRTELFTKKLGQFTVLVGEIRENRPTKSIKADRLRVCSKSLIRLLEAFERRVRAAVLNEDGDLSDAHQDSASHVTEASSLAYTLLQAGTRLLGMGFYTPYKIFPTTYRGAEPTPPAPIARTDSFETASDVDDQYARLEALGAKIESGVDLCELCQKFVRTRITYRRIKKIVSLAQVVKLSFESAHPSQKIDTRNEPIHWKNRIPWNDSTRLFELLSDSALDDGHLATLRLDGLGLNRSEMRFSVFMSSCPSPQSSWEWREGEFMSIKKKTGNDGFFYLCDYTKKEAPRGVKTIFFDSDFLWNPRDRPYIPAPFPDAYPTISLAELIRRGVLGRGKHGIFNDGDKAILAFSIGLCLLHLFSGSWMQREWTAESIHFLHAKTEAQIPQIFNIHFPYIKITLKRSDPIKTVSLTTDSCRPYLLALAQLLIEIETGAPSQADLTKIELDAVALEIQKRGKSDYGRAVLGCTSLTLPEPKLEAAKQPRLGKRRRPKISFDVMRQRISEEIISPLEENYRRFLSVAQEQSHGPFEIPLEPGTGLSSASQSKPNTFSATQVAASHSPPKSTVSFFYDHRKATPEEVKEADNWIKKADEYLKLIPKNYKTSINVAVFDTGVNLKSADLNDYRDKVSFLDGGEQDNLDTDGHGTLVTYLLLRLAPKIKVFVLKISETRKIEMDKTTIGKLAKEIGKLEDIHIINISFGFTDDKDPLLLPIENALKTAHIDKGIITVAAANNDGGNESTAWPATYEYIICVNSSTHKGNSSTFTPTQKTEMICTLGEGLEVDFQGKSLAESGTSFATPIAGALIATVLDFVEHAKASHGDDHVLRKLRTRSGMMAILTKFCVDPKGGKRNGYDYVTPWYFLRREDAFVLIKDALRNL